MGERRARMRRTGVYRGWGTGQGIEEEWREVRACRRVGAPTIDTFRSAGKIARALYALAPCGVDSTGTLFARAASTRQRERIMTTPAADPADRPPPKPSETHEPAEESGSEEKQVEEAQSLDAKTTYEVIRREGKKELDRSSDALFWSGLAAGLSMGFSFLDEALLHSHLPDASWRPLVAKLGYSVGFVIVILGSQQLFTENTLTPMVPLLHEKTRETLRNVLRLWAVVFVANVIGALMYGLALGRLAVVEPETQRALSEIARETMKFSFWVTLPHGVYAGWLIALLVWMLPEADVKLLVIVLMTWLVGVGGFAHVVAGASEVFYAAWRGEATWAQAVLGFVLPALIGNMLGGITLVAALNHAQATASE
jgi:formate/nitrite transporter FocA (FNT family)